MAGKKIQKKSEKGEEVFLREGQQFAFNVLGNTKTSDYDGNQSKGDFGATRGVWANFRGGGGGRGSFNMKQGSGGGFRHSGRGFRGSGRGFRGSGGGFRSSGGGRGGAGRFNREQDDKNDTKRVLYGRVNKESGQHSLSDEQQEKLKKLPLFNDQLLGKQQFLGHSIETLLVLVDNMRHAVVDHIQEVKQNREPSKNFWDRVSQYREGATADECKELWKKLSKELPEPTVQDSVNTCKRSICKRLGLHKWRIHHPDWPKYPPTFLHNLREAATSVLGSTANIPGKSLKDMLTPTGSSILENKSCEAVMSYHIDVVEFLEKHPEGTALKSMEVYEYSDVIL